MFGTRKGLYLVEPERQTCVQVCPQISFVNCIGKIGQTLLIGSVNGLWIYKDPGEAEPIKFENSVISKGNIVNDITDDGRGSMAVQRRVPDSFKPERQKPAKV